LALLTGSAWAGLPFRLLLLLLPLLLLLLQLLPLPALIVQPLRKHPPLAISLRLPLRLLPPLLSLELLQAVLHRFCTVTVIAACLTLLLQARPARHNGRGGSA
jgi:hypothetical protein